MLHRLTKLTYIHHTTNILAFEQSIYLILILACLRVHCSEPLTGVGIRLDPWHALDQESSVTGCFAWDNHGTCRALPEHSVARR